MIEYLCHSLLDAKSELVALTLRQSLVPVNDPQFPIFPPSFMPVERGDKSDYVIDTIGGAQSCLLDTIPSQANRLEPIFKNEPYAALVPQIVIKIDNRTVNLLDMGHRAADAVVRSSSKGQQFVDATSTMAVTHNATDLAKLAPTSLIFGLWDSRGSGLKVPRILSSSIRAFDVERCKGPGQYRKTLTQDEVENLGYEKEFLSKQGFNDAPASSLLGGIVVHGKIIRDAVLNIAPLRALTAGSAEQTRKLQNYILGLALLAFVSPMEWSLRQGCVLVQDPKEPLSLRAVARTGRRDEVQFPFNDVVIYAQSSAMEFGVGASFEIQYEEKKAKDILKKAKEEAKNATKKRGARDASED